MSIQGLRHLPRAQNPRICGISRFGKSFQQLSGDFPAVFLEKPRTETPQTATAFSSFLRYVYMFETLCESNRAILRYYRCDTPYRAILFQGIQHSPTMVRYPPLVPSFTQAHLCDTPFCNISRDNCAIPHKNKDKIFLRYYRCKYRAI